MPRVLITVVCPRCEFEQTRLREVSDLGVPVTAAIRTETEYILRCDNCEELIRVTHDDLRDAQHELLVALGED